MWLGLPGAGAAHAVVLAPLALTAIRGRGRHMLDLHHGFALGTALLHLALWRTRHSRIPLLDEGAEGLAPGWGRPYNLVIYPWALLSAIALCGGGARRWWIVLGLAASPATGLAAIRQQRWLDQQAQRTPRWWNRGHQVGRQHRGPEAR